MHNPFQMLKEAQKFQEALKVAQAELATLEMVGEAGAGMVKVHMNARYVVLHVHLEKELFLEAHVTVEALVAAAMRDAISKVEETSRQKMSELLVKMGLPANFNLPFMPGGSH